jgi:ABC-type Mn2+/Zn2+ transport system permease subunit
MTIDALLLSIAMAIAAGLVGCFAIMRRMALAADAMSHVALPGIGVALALRIHPVFGAVAMLFFGALLVWALEERSRAATETVIGVVFSVALAAGSLMMSGEDLIDALFGTAGVLSPVDSTGAAAGREERCAEDGGCRPPAAIVNRDPSSVRGRHRASDSARIRRPRPAPWCT